MNRREMLRLTGLGLGAGVLSAPAAHSAADLRRDKPNIIFILADDLGYGDLGCYGQQVIETPNIDRMAAEGMRFTQCYAGSTVCAPSRCALMTGLHTGHCFVRGNQRVPLPAEEVTIAEGLKDAGYYTGIIGKWGLGNEGTTGTPNRQGYDYAFGYLDQKHAHNYYPEYLWKNEERYPLKGNVESKEQPGVSVERKVYSHDLFAEEALRFAEEHKEGPFFLYFAVTVPHANNERGSQSGNGMEVPDYGPYADKDWPEPQKGHAAMISRLDRDVGRLLTRLKELGLDDDTIVFFSSDNGTHKEGGADPEFFHSSGLLRGYKRDLYEGGIRVPMIVRWPGHVTAGAVSKQVWAFWDFMPTALELAGAPAPKSIDGISMTNALLGREQGNHEFLYWEFHERGFLQAVRMGDWKAVRLASDKPLELYDLRNDVGESKDVAKEHTDIVAKIETYLKGARTFSEAWPGTSKP
jgi:arylsulfatase A-like enzyme